MGGYIQVEISMGRYLCIKDVTGQIATEGIQQSLITY